MVLTLSPPYSLQKCPNCCCCLFRQFVLLAGQGVNLVGEAGIRLFMAVAAGDTSSEVKAIVDFIVGPALGHAATIVCCFIVKCGDEL